MNDNKHFLIHQLHEIGAIQFGDFQLRSGLQSPFYLDLRRLVSYPQLQKALCETVWQYIKSLDFDLICGVPYAALSFAAIISAIYDKPTIVKRKERKKYGTKKLLEGVFEKGQNCLVLEDIITTGGSLVETIEDLENEGLTVVHNVVLIDREQGGKAILNEKGYQLHAIFTISEVLDSLFLAKKIDENTVQKVKDFIQKNKVLTPISPLEKKEKITLSAQNKRTYEQRLTTTNHVVTKRLLEIIIDKKTNLICSADVTTQAELLHLAKEVAPHICALKTHTDIVKDFDQTGIDTLKQLAAQHQFLLFEDRKFADIGNTVKLQYTCEALDISSWADMITVHVIAGASTIETLKKVKTKQTVGMVVIVEMSTEDTLTDENYIQKALQIVENQQDSVIGIVAQKALLKNNSQQLQFTPGINLAQKGDQQGQQYNTPERAFGRGTNIIIVGRGIYRAADPATAALTYKNAAWEAYQNQVSETIATA